MTYSIVARDPDTGELGVAVQTRWPNVGSIVPWAEPGVGAVATQSFAEESYGPLGLGRIRDGMEPAEALEGLLADDPGRDTRQVGMVDATGRSAAHTGARCVEAAGHVTDANLSIQANMMERATVWPAMAEAYRATAGELADRLMAALIAGEGEGGDVRGRQSAAILVVPASGPAWATRYDLRVEDSRAPLDELARLLRLARAYEAFDRAQQLAEAGDRSAAAASMDEARVARSRRRPDHPLGCSVHGTRKPDGRRPAILRGGPSRRDPQRGAPATLCRCRSSATGGGHAHRGAGGGHLRAGLTAPSVGRRGASRADRCPA